MCPTAEFSLQVYRKRWRILGQVQGVGYRPFVYRQARASGISGYVRNDDRGVTIEAQGSAAQLKRFSRALDAERPPLASIDQVIVEDIPVCDEPVAGRFLILDSNILDQAQAASSARVGITIDSAVCPACLRELLDKDDRRHLYAMTNCTDCGPRYTIIDRIPYDRPNTTMRGFELCDACRSEYNNPGDRRYHAQPIACHDCGPKLELVNPVGGVLSGDPVPVVMGLLSEGRVVAIKGLGGFHLAVRCDDEQAVARLRRCKQRDGKPFALMCRSLDVAHTLVELSESAGALLCSPAAPIVLATRRPDARVAPSVAPGSHRLGVMLPYTPIHQLLFESLDPSIDALVMTSANASNEPLTIDNDEALDRLKGLCDAMLWHDRPIRRRVDDSVVLDIKDEKPLPIRRARGYVPKSISLPTESRVHGLCIGGELKNTIGFVRDGRVTLSQHIGDLGYTSVFDHFKENIDDLVNLFDVQPKWIAHDLHPMYMGTVYAKELAKRWDVPLIGVQHHHAHAASVMAEHGETGPVLAVVCDGVGYGDDGMSWGGELLLADLVGYERLAHLKPIDLIGGDAAAEDTRRCGLALLQQAYGEAFAEHPAVTELIPDETERQMFIGMLQKGLNCTPTTATGRYFDGIAALLGVCQYNSFEAQAPMRLETEAYANEAALPGTPLYRIHEGEPQVIDLSALVAGIVEGKAQGRSAQILAAMFHDQLTWAWVDVVDLAVRRLGIKTVALSGGVFCNERLSRSLTERLKALGVRVLAHRAVPANDGGLALGQAAVASARLDKGLV